MEPCAAGDDAIAQFQQRRRQFKPRWNGNWLFVFFPGFLLFMAVGPAGELLWGWKPAGHPWLLFPGIGLCILGMVQGVYLMLRYRRCPVCEKFQKPRICFPFRICASCGARLSLGWKDST